MSQFSKPWEELNFSDNFIFCKVMKDKKLCAQLLEILLGFKVREINYLESEHPIDEYYETRGIRMDVYVEDNDKIYNIEMQTGDYKDLLLRARYYQSASDISSTPRRTQFFDLRETYIIFICKDDPFGEGLPLYSESKNFKETTNIPYNDKTHKLFYNCSAYAKVHDEDISAVLEFIYTLKAKSQFTENIQSSVFSAKQHPTFKDDYMYFGDILEEEKEMARKEGLAEGKAEGLAEGKAEGLAKGKAEGKAEGLVEGQEKGKKAALLEAAVIAVKDFQLNPKIVAEKYSIDINELKKALG